MEQEQEQNLDNLLKYTNLILNKDENTLEKKISLEKLNNNISILKDKKDYFLSLEKEIDELFKNIFDK